MCTVLVVDSSLKALKRIFEILEEIGHQAVCTSEPNQAVGLCREIDFDLVLCDLYMESQEFCKSPFPLGGLDLIWNLTDEYPDVPIIAMSAAVPREQLEKMKRVGIKGVVAKPFEKDELISEIESVVS